MWGLFIGGFMINMVDKILIGRLKGRIMELEHTVESLRNMFDEVLYDDNARNEYKRIDEEYKNEKDKDIQF